ncbi:duf1275 domain protein [Colletotrichum asianum]|uniref:Duf1275 domain protein n=1 Tax=Colletotrichum asianum TaxID=702518 RepID=A0A8H3W199_9PEZI|nr:duf1275 domain protein [Colletotrichum asianum]
MAEILHIRQDKPVLAATEVVGKATSYPDWLEGLRNDINERFSDVPLLSCCFISGLCDSIAFNASGVFVSMQTGNTIFLALGTANLPSHSPNLWLRALVSIVAFWAGCFTFSKTRLVHPKCKGTLFASFLFQSVLISVSAALAQAGVVPSFALTRLGSDDTEILREIYEDHITTLIPIALLAFQFGGQIVTSRILGFNEVPTNVLTSLYCDLLSDPMILAPFLENPKRNRRVVAVLLTVGGGIISGWLQRTNLGMPAVLWIAAIVKLVIALLWAGWKDECSGSGSEETTVV